MVGHKDLGAEGQNNRFLLGQTEGWMDGWMDGRTDGQTDEQMDGQTDKWS